MTDISDDLAPKFLRKEPRYDYHRSRKFILTGGRYHVDDMAFRSQKGHYKRALNRDSGRADLLLRDFSK